MDVMTQTVNLPERAILDTSSVKYEGVKYNGVCSAAKSLMLEFLKICFENLPEGNQYKFNENMEDSKISILDKFTFNLEQVDKRPSIVVHRGAIGYNKIGRDQRFKEARLQRREDSTGQNDGTTYKTGLFRGSLSVQCYGKGQTLQAEELGESVFELITDMEDVLRKVGFFECFSNGVGEEQPVSSGSKIKYIMVPVSVQFSMQRTWSVTPINLRRIKDLVLSKLVANDTDMI